jgi:metal-responsive CopG/Arc/MetJ family transcriptional regulator
MEQTKFEKWSISLPKTLGSKARQRAVKESRTKSELIREALRSYLHRGEDTFFQESSDLAPKAIVEKMRATGLYSEAFLKDLQESLTYANQEG